MKKIACVIMGLALIAIGCSDRSKDGGADQVQKDAGDRNDAPPGTSADPGFAKDVKALIGLETAVLKKEVIDEQLEFPAEIVSNPANTAVVNGPVAGWVRALHVVPGARVEKGAVVAVMENPENLGQQIEIKAPLGGIVAERPAHIGEWLDSGKPIVEIVDYGTLLGVVRVYPDEMSRIRIGLDVDFAIGPVSGRGRISFIAPVVDPVTRTVEIRAELANPRRELRANAYAQAKIILGKKMSLVCPQTALLPEEAHFVAYVKTGDRFEKRTVETGLKQNGLVEILDGLREGEIVVTKGAYQLKNLTFKSNVDID